jgi:hypothetical protein
MKFVHHKPIKIFRLEGSIHDEAAIPRLKQEYIRLLRIEMKLNGYAQRLDIDPDFTIQYNSTKENFYFYLSMYGTYVGTRKSEWIIGIDGIEVLGTPQSKSRESLLDQESQLNQK